MKKQNYLPKTLPSFIWFFIKKQPVGFFILLFTMSAWALQEAVYPYFIKLIIDRVVEYKGHRNEIFSHLYPTLKMAVIMAITIEIGYRINDFCMIKVYPKFMANMRLAIFEYVQQHSHHFFSENLAGNITSKMFRLPENIQRIMDEIITIFYPVLLAIIISSVFLYNESPIFAVALIIWLAIHLFITSILGRKYEYYSAVRAKKLNKLNGKIVDSIINIMNVRLFARYKYEKSYLSNYQNDEAEAFAKSLHCNAVLKTVLGIISLIFLVSVIGGALYYYKIGKLSLGDVALVMSYQSLLGLIWYMGMEFVIFFELVGSSNEALSIIQQPYEVKDIENAQDLQVSAGVIEFRNVSFNYTRNKNVFKDQSVIINSKQKVGLVGFSGSGKTTFVNLILRYFDIASGQILIDNQDISQVTQKSLRSAVAVIPQDSSLFHRTIFENIKYGNIDATGDEIIAATKQADAYEFIMKLPEKFDTYAGDRGAKLSGGQRQRIVIARAILKNAPILILDEATSALDSSTENNIQNSLRELMQDKTAIVIAHRLSTLLDMDRILVFNQGYIVEDGTHEELLALNGHYNKLWNMQMGGFLIDGGGGGGGDDGGDNEIE